MTTTSRLPDDYAYDEVVYENDQTRSVPYDNYVDVHPNDYDNTARTSKNGTYNIVAKDYGDHKVNYYIPREHGDDYGISQLEDMSIVEEQPIYEPPVVRRRVYQQYDNYDYNNEIQYVEEVPAITPRTIVNVSPARHRETQVFTEIYEPPPPPTETIEYIYEAEPMPQIQEETEYFIEERVPQPIYVEEPRPIRRTVVIQEPVILPPSPQLVSRRTLVIPRTPSPELVSRRTLVIPRTPSPEPVSRRALVFPRTPSPEPIRTPRRTLIIPRSPSPDPAKSSRRSLVFSKSSSFESTKTNRRRTNISQSYSLKQQRTTRSPPLPVRAPPPPPTPPIKRNIPKPIEQPPSLMEIVAQNRAKRGTHIRKPRREIYEDKVHDLPTYHKNIIKNGFIVHK